MVTILVVDDDAPTRSLLCDTLHIAGYSTITGADGLTGLHLAERHTPDLIVADVNMPQLDGFQMLTRIRNTPRTSTIPVILLTAENNSHSLRQGMLEGAEDYLTKPVKTHDLLASIRVQLQKRAALEEKHQSTLRLLRKNIVYALPHELRTPLHVISGYADLLEMEQGASRPEQVLECARFIGEASRRLERLIENYLIYAQLELIYADPEELKAARNHLLKDSSIIIESVALNKAHQFNRVNDFQFDLCRLGFRISEKDLGKIVYELVDNALKFSEPGTPITITSRREGDDLYLVISDEGRGMSLEQIQLLGAYIQFGRDLYEQQGIGMGFTVARRLIELHEGTITVESTPGAGTLITIRFSMF